MINFFNLDPIKRLTVSSKHADGRNMRGRITSYHKGGGAKRKYRMIDFRRVILEVPAFIRRFEYDPNRNSYIALICYANGILSYTLAIEGTKFGNIIINTKKYFIDYGLGTSLILKNFPIGSYVNAIALSTSGNAKIARSAGTYAQVLKKIGLRYIILKLKSGEHRAINSSVMATSGVISNSNFKNTRLTKAGQSRLLGKRPIVRGVAMNPIDHPHGGNTSGGRPSVSPWGKLAKAGKTRSYRKTSSNFILKSKIKRSLQ